MGWPVAGASAPVVARIGVLAYAGGRCASRQSQAMIDLRQCPPLLRRNPSALLLAVQLLGVLLYPLMEGHAGSQILLTAFGLLVLGLALWVVRRSPVASWGAVVLAGVVVLLSVINVLHPLPALTAAIALAESVFYFYAALSLCAYMLQDQHASRDELFAAAATFTVLAWAFAHLFNACQAIAPHSFGAQIDPEQPRTWMELLFLSFSTLSGVGLGDIIPLKPMARALVMLGEFTGVMYVALVVSRLVGLLTIKRLGR